MYLSKVSVEWDRAKNPYELHRVLWSLFPDRPDENRSFLFRVESFQRNQPAIALMQSFHSPTESGEGVRLLASKEFSLQVLKVDQLLQFRVTGNPTKKIKDKDNPTRKIRVPIIGQENQLNWLARKLKGEQELEGAAQLLSATVETNPPLYFQKKGQAGKLITVTYDGVLQITEPIKLIKIVETGIGSAKSFGCGMLSLAPV